MQEELQILLFHGYDDRKLPREVTGWNTRYESVWAKLNHPEYHYKNQIPPTFIRLGRLPVGERQLLDLAGELTDRITNELYADWWLDGYPIRPEDMPLLTIVHYILCNEEVFPEVARILGREPQEQEGYKEYDEEEDD